MTRRAATACLATVLAAGCGDDTPVAPSAVATGRIIFVTSQAVTGNLGGVEGADRLCGTLAAAAGFGGTYRAWLSDTAGRSPVADFVQGDEPFVMVSGVRVADHWADLADGTINNPIAVDELGEQPATDTGVWTGTDVGGVPAAGAATCGDWRSTAGAGQVGDLGQIGPRWTADGTRGCDEPGRLYCVQQ